MQPRRSALVAALAVAVSLLSGCTGAGSAAIATPQATAAASTDATAPAVPSSAVQVANARPAVHGAHNLAGIRRPHRNR